MQGAAPDRGSTNPRRGCSASSRDICKAGSDSVEPAIHRDLEEATTVTTALEPTPAPKTKPATSAWLPLANEPATGFESVHRTPPKKRTWRPASEIAVDLGTANTLVLVNGEGVVLNEPSVAAVEQATGEIMGIGLEAKRMLGRTPEGILAVRPMKDGVISNFEVAEKMLRHFLRTVLDRRILRVKPTVIVCVPSGITEVERRAVRDSAQSAGVRRLLRVAEPMAAGIGIGLRADEPSGNMVIDIGGGTTNVAVIALSGIVCDASIRTGGDAPEQAIVQYMRKNYSLLIGEPTAEVVKITIGSAAPL